jgi:hypothetical protein
VGYMTFRTSQLIHLYRVARCSAILPAIVTFATNARTQVLHVLLKYETGM